VSEVVLAVVAAAIVLLIFILAPWRGRQDALDERDVYTALTQDALDERDVYTALTGEDPDEA